MSRLLSPEESQAARFGFAAAWNWLGGYWFPLTDETPAHTIAFDEFKLQELLSDVQLSSILNRHHSGRCFRLREFDPDEETSVLELENMYGWSEQFLVPPNFEWAVYWSHEDTITFGGEALIEKIKSAVPKWQSALCSWASA